ncbi:MAG: glycine cleavage system aminomethyltransferase GcvT [Planctomycetota bacterium]
MTDGLRKTPLNDAHRRLKATLVDFGGWGMPMQYGNIVDEHRAVRTGAGIFDVSHMGRLAIEGADRLGFLSRLVPTNLEKAEPGDVVYSMFTTEGGGVVDDITILVRADDIRLVVNASNAAAVKDWLAEHRDGMDVAVRDETEAKGMIALQGPLAAAILLRHTAAAAGRMFFFQFIEGTFDGRPVLISRTGYTGEDGFEIIMSAADAPAVWDALLADGAAPIGLGARDTLRMEACLPLYGHELGRDINPIEAGLGWAVTSKADYLGRAQIEKVRRDGVARKLVAFRLEGRVLARKDAEFVKDGRKVGVVTSGTFAPSLGCGAGMGFVEAALAAPGATLDVVVRERPCRAVLVKPPLVTKHTVARKPKPAASVGGGRG